MHEFDDILRDNNSQNLEIEISDFVILRADGLLTYQFTIVVDAQYQGINLIVRGANLLASTLRQIWLQRLHNYSTPNYLHLPVAVNAQGEKLSKQTLAQVVEILAWEIANWDNKTLK